ncbi:MAG: STT3 domain-containing protein [Conexivisphaerales archaeon]
MINIRRPKITAGGAFAALVFSLLMALTLYIRLMPAKYGLYLNEFDPYYHYYVTNIVVNDLLTYGLGGISKYMHTISYNFWYPWGRDLATTSPSGLYFMVAIFYIIVHFFATKLTLYEFTEILPIIVGALISFPVYFIAKGITGNKYIGLLGVLLLSSVPGLLIRTDWGWYKGTPFAFLFMPTAIMLLVYGFDKNRAKILLALIAGFLVGYAQTMWGGTENLNGVIALAFLFLPLYSKLDIKTLEAQALYIVGAMVAAIYPVPGFGWIYSPTMLLLYLSIVISALYIVNEKYKILSRTAFFASFFGVLVVGLGVVSFVLPHLVNLRYLSALDFLLRLKPSIVSTVAEQLPISGLDLAFTYGITLLLSIAAGYYLMKKRTVGSVIVALFLLWSFYVGSSMGELLDYVGIAAIIGAPIGIYYIFENIKGVPVKEKKGKIAKEKMGKAKGKTYGYTYEKGAVAVVLLGLLVVPVGYYWIPANNAPVTIVNSSTILNGIVPAWVDALNWMSNSSNMQPHSVVVAWWDYGYWITVMGNQTTVIDNATINSTQIGLVAKMYLSPTTEAVNIFNRLHGQYVVVFATGVDLYTATHDQYLSGYQETGQLYGIGGDESKVSAMIVWAGWESNQTDYIASNGLLTPYFWNDTLLGHLEPLRYLGWGQIDTTTGQLINITSNYINSSTYYQLPLFSYQPYYTSNSTPFSLVYSSPLQLASNGMWAQVLIYKYVGNSTN